MMAADRLEKMGKLLLQAVESLRDSTSSPPPPAPERNSAAPNASQASGCSERASVIGEPLSTIVIHTFNFAQVQSMDDNCGVDGMYGCG